MRDFNYSKYKNNSWDSEILGLVAQIHEFKGRQCFYMKEKEAALDRLVEIAKIQSTEASNKLEGIVTTSTRIKQLCNDKTTPRNRDEEEIMGYRDVLDTIHNNYEYIPMRASYILQLHRDLFKYSERTIGGKYKNTQNIIAENRQDGMQRVIFTPLAPYETPEAIEQICDSFNRVIDSCEVDSLILIPIFIHDFLCIHPFNDGNGRMSRLLTTLLLYRSGYMIGKYISIESMIEKTKVEYYSVLEECGEGWHEGEDNPLAFVKYLLRILLAAYREFENRIELVDNKLPTIEQVRSAIEGKIGKFTKTEILEMLPGIGKASVENALKKLTEEGSIQRHGVGKATFYTRS